MQRMRSELLTAGYDVEFVAVNATSGIDTPEQLAAKCRFPILQDTLEAAVWTRHGGVKDDIYIFDADGLMRTFLPVSGGLSTNLSTTEGYDNVRNAILAIADGAE